MDYGRFKYETAKRDRDSKKTKKTQELKEVKFRPKTGTHDFEFKVKHARRFLEEGSKVRLQIQFRGRELVHPEMGKSILTRVCKIVEDIATVHTAPQMEGNRMSMILNPKPRKEGSKPKPVVARPAAVPGAASGSASGLVPEGVEPEELDEDLDDEDLDDDDDDDDDDMTDDTDGLDDVDDDDDDDMSDDTDGLDDDTDDAAT